MRAGSLRHVAELWNPSTVSTDFSTRAGYALVASGIRCSLRPIRAGEQRGERQDAGMASVEIRMRWDPAVQTGSRLVVDGVTHEVLFPHDPTGLRRELWLPCKVVQ